jgi:hypothetical protein
MPGINGKYKPAGVKVWIEAKGLQTPYNDIDKVASWSF